MSCNSNFDQNFELELLWIVALFDLTLWKTETYFELDNEEATAAEHFNCVYITVKGTVASSFSCWDGRYKGSKLSMHCMLYMSTLSTQGIKAL